jgi:hypothetical protein
MKYLGLAYFTPDKFAAMAPDDVKKLVSQCPALDDKMRATDKVLISASLGDLDYWRTLRPRSGKTHVTDGPYTESKEVVGGLFIIEAVPMTRRCASPPCTRRPRWAKKVDGSSSLSPWISTGPDEGLDACLKYASVLCSPQTPSRLRESSRRCHFWAERRRL